jgi:hypothetical protein
LPQAKGGRVGNFGKSLKCNGLMCEAHHIIASTLHSLPRLGCISKTRDLYPSMIYTSVSFVGVVPASRSRAKVLCGTASISAKAVLVRMQT